MFVWDWIKERLYLRALLKLIEDRESDDIIDVEVEEESDDAEVEGQSGGSRGDS